LTNGIGIAQLALNYGAYDFGGTLADEVVSTTGARSTELTTDKNICIQVGWLYSCKKR
jgi:cyclic dehypoxanthinyl futalosine synthase